MSIFIIRGPEASGPLIRTAPPLPAPVLKALVHRAIDAGTTVAIRACGSEQELLDALRVADHSRGEITLLDPGACVHSVRLQRLLPHLHNAYVEVHDDDTRAPEACLPPDVGRRIGVAHGYCAQSYMHGLEIALDHLGRSEIVEGVHVGT
ncbi:3-dehydroquinate dehydratase [Stenotrophomonas rhizophila]|uniref:3-dehydroquinate dehydratase n=1 Tax=Stenotrophomonas rhizophila TaxID=216778 RepID=UPI001E55E18B|nr:3-dehydroquinate dehydratase [Stenotrophomonas rhizophila]MCC7633130.1 3-dehydroquinate dehydratase [Stenotrophomonas rhizophila]MCC7662023.1 3-dehydroquinate dehydratase [Stenotrophomonas rhizophila]